MKLKLFKNACAVFLLAMSMSSGLQAQTINEFVTTWDMTKPGNATGIQVAGIYTSADVNYSWSSTDTTTGTGTIPSGNNNDIVLPITGTGTVTLRLGTSGTQTGLLRFFINGEHDRERLIDVNQWGTAIWTDWAVGFQGCINLTTLTATDQPDLSGATRVRSMFNGAASFTGVGSNIGSWNVSTITDFFRTFRNAKLFNQPLTNWDVSAATTMREMFYDADAFNQDLSSWVPSNVTNMQSMFGLTALFNNSAVALPWDLSAVTNFNGMFQGAAKFNADISGWTLNTTAGITMISMFKSSGAFNQDLSPWNVSKVTTMSEMFNAAADFNNGSAPLLGGASATQWDVSSVTDFLRMFRSTPFNQPLTNWDVTGATIMQEMFYNTDAFNQDLSSWVPSNVTNMQSMFGLTALFNNSAVALPWDLSAVTNFNGMFQGAAKFNADISGWTLNTTAGITMISMFKSSGAFNQDLSPWNVSKVTTMSEMFNAAEVFKNGSAPLLGGASPTQWDVSSVTDFLRMFRSTPFNQPLTNWDVTGATRMQEMFSNASAFNQNLSSWVPSSVTNMQQMFDNALLFNQDLSNWNVSQVTNMSYMFRNAAAFNNAGIPLTWNVAGVTLMESMFENASAFNQDLAAWSPTSVTNFTNFLNNSGLTQATYDALISAWSQLDLQDSQAIGGQGLSYCASVEQRNNLSVNQSITFQGDSFGCSPGGVGAGIAFWQRADALSLTNGDQVSSWFDQTGNAFNFDQGTALNQPVFDEVTSVNFNPSVAFDGVDTMLESAVAGPTDLSKTSFFIVSKENNRATEQAFLSFKYVSDTDEYTHFAPDAMGNLRFKADQTVTIAATMSDPSFDVTYDTDLLEQAAHSEGEFGISSFFNNSNANVQSSPTGTTSIYANTATTSAGNGGSYTNSGNTFLGASALSTRHFNGAIAEVIGYTGVLTGANLDAVHSYLGVKYGISLPIDYLAADATTIIWNQTTNAGYNNNIFGLGRNQDGALDQRISISQKNDAILTLAMDTDFTSSNTSTSRAQFAADASFLMVGHNGETIPSWTDTGAPNNFQISNRQWKTQVTATTQPIFAQFNVADADFDIPVLLSDVDYFLVVDSNGDGSLSDETPTRLLNTSGDLWSSTTTLADGAIFALATAFITSPGGVDANLALWLKADAGIASIVEGNDVNQWTDQSANGYTADQAANTRRPTYKGKVLNFNPAVSFGAGTTATGFDLGANYIYAPAANNGMHIFSAVDPKTSGDRKFIYDFGFVADNAISLALSTDQLNINEGGTDNSALQSTASATVVDGEFNFGGNKNIKLNGESVISETMGWAEITAVEIREQDSPGDGGPVSIGRQSKTIGSTRRVFVGEMGEVIVYNGAITDTQAQQVRSYLALKYGITLDQTVAQAYLASDGSKMWDETVDIAYNKDIFGIGKDAAAELDQQISKSVNAEAVLTVSTDNNFTGANKTHAVLFDDLEFISHANNAAGAILATTGAEVNASLYTNLIKVNRDWHIQEVGDVGCVYYNFDVSGLGLTAAQDLYVVLADDAAFTTNVEIKLLDKTAASVGLNWLADSSNNYMTLATFDNATIPVLPLGSGPIVVGVIEQDPANNLVANTYLNLLSNNLGVVLTRVSGTASITAPAEGMIVYDTSDSKFKVNTDGSNTGWRDLGASAAVSKFCN